MPGHFALKHGGLRAPYTYTPSLVMPGLDPGIHV